MDSAVTRPGRFDLLLFVGTPNLPARVARLQSRLEATALGAEQQAEAAEAFRALLHARWDELRFLTFAENEGLANTVLDAFIRLDAAEAAGLPPLPLTTTSSGSGTSSSSTSSNSERLDGIRALLAARADTILRTATIRGGVREEYEASERLSRL